MSTIEARLREEHRHRQATFYPPKGAASVFLLRQELDTLRTKHDATCERLQKAGEKIESLQKELMKLRSTLAVAGPNIGTVQKAAAAHFGMTVADLQSMRRTHDVVRPRQIAVWLCKQFTAKSLPQIGNSFGGRDHTTVLHSCRRIDEILEAEPEGEIAQAIEAIKQSLGVE